MNREGGRFADGLLIGLLLGGAIVFLLGTEKGKKVLKLLTSEGGIALEGILRELDQDTSEPKQIPHQSSKKKREPELVDAEELDFASHPSENGYKEDIKRETKVTHRFFRGSKAL